MQVSGFSMFKVVKKLKHLKKPFRKLLYEKGNLHDNVIRLHDELDKVQTCLDADPYNSSLREEEAVAVVAFNEALIMEEKFLKQKVKVDWLREGDSNSAYFHKAVKSRTSRSRIDVVASVDGTLFENDKAKLEDNTALHMVRTVSRQEVKDALFSMGNDKAPGPDDYTAAFFKEAWDIVADDVTIAVSEFFINGKILKELNYTIIALIPKESLKALVSPNQSAFVPGRSISDNILLTQELTQNYHLDRGSPRCAFKVDIQKAYDTVDWDFLKMILIGFGFHDRKTWSSQGDPLSPYLFTLVMEILTLMLQRRFRDSDSFTYHWYCSELELINLRFAEDLFLFAHGDVGSTYIIKEALVEFKNAFGTFSTDFIRFKQFSFVFLRCQACLKVLNVFVRF
nr:hypothetical protein [Tanacetum cinerariifolium]